MDPIKMVSSINNTIEKVKKVFGNLIFSTGSEGYDNIQKWLVKNFITKYSFGVIYGKSGSRKSFIAIDLSCAIATGSYWQNQRTHAGGVIYVAAEGQIGMSRRVKAWEKANNKKVEHLYILGQSIIMSEKSSRNDLINSIRQIECNDKIKIELVVLDTLARNFDGDENSSEAMGRFIQGCDLVKEATNVSILCVHHSGKDASKGGRGSSSLIGACDFEYRVTHDEKTGLTTLSNTKQKEAESAPDLVFDFQSIDLGIICEDGKPITSLGLSVPAEVKIEDTWENNLLLKGLKEVFNGMCTRAELRSIFPVKAGTKENTANQQFRRAVEELLKAKKITIQQSGNKAHPNDIITAIV
ncbi:helicase RepA family protein [Photobacterium leiognathi]|uniref:helicase RepA family protein n=1 Tax=Photobacterium leiognathi TaxID=553611 RepID=UPI003AF37495